MIRDFTTIEELNEYYASCLSSLAQISTNVNPEVLEIMLSGLLEDYNNNLDLIKLNKKHELKIYKLRKKWENKLILQEVKFECKKTQFQHYTMWKLNKSRLKLFKKEFLNMSNENIKNEEERIKNMQIDSFSNENEVIKLSHGEEN